MNLAPIVLFVYNRPEHLKKTIYSLCKNIYASESELIIFSDGHKDNEDAKKVAQVREYLKTIKGFKKIRIIEYPQNLGTGNGIINGINEAFSQHDKIIVLEDDMITSKYFLKFMNEALDFYKDEDRVVSINGYTYPVKYDLPEVFFLRGARCWGWASWRRGWDLFEKDGQKLLDRIKAEKLEYDFNINNSCPGVQTLKDQINGKNDSWAVRWLAATFLENKLSVYPGRSLVKNIGFDYSGTHCTPVYELNVKLSDTPILINSVPIEENPLIVKSLEEFFDSIHNKKLSNRLKRNIKKLLRYFVLS